MNDILLIPISFATSFFIAFVFIPTIVRVSKKKKLFDKPNSRSSHSKLIPNLGGWAIFAGFIMSVSLFLDIYYIPDLQFIIASVVVVFFVGMKDDILVIAPLTKFIGQMISALILIVFADIRISNFHGFFDIHEINYFTSVLVSLLVILVIENGFNFIDGIDGLASAIAIITAGTFGYWFFLIGELQLTLIALSLIGAVLAFFIFNVFGKQNKILMGDTGALIIGVVLSILAIKFNELNLDKSKAYYLYTSPTVSFSILIIPLFDLIRVVFIRLFSGKAIFKADKNHLHHQLLQFRFSHLQVTLIICALNLFFIVFAFYTAQFMSIRRQLLLILIIATLISYIISILVKRVR